MQRIKAVLMAIDEIMSEAEYYDEETGASCIDVTEEQVYNWLMEMKDFRFLGTETIKELIHKMFTDNDFRMENIYY